MNIPSFILPIAAITMISAAVHAEGPALTPVEKSQLLYKQGMAAEEAGNAQTALNAYKEAVQLNPRNANARYRLGVIKDNFDTIAAKGRKASLDTIVIPEYNLNDASFNDAIRALQLLIEKQTEGTVVPNFIIQDPKGKLADHKLNLTLKNIPAGTVLKYLLEASAAKARIDEHAVVITPR